MDNVLIVAYLLIVLALIAVILLQRSEGGALGIGGGGGFMTARGSANLLTRTTAVLATLFFAMAIGLTVLSEVNRGSSGILERAAQGEDGEAPSSVLDALNSLQGDLPVPAETPAETAPPADAAAPETELPVPPAPAEAVPAAEPAPAVEPAPAPASGAGPADNPAAVPAAPTN